MSNISNIVGFNMPWEQIAIGLLSVTSAVLGWIARTLYAAMVKLREDHDTLRVHIAEKYLPYDRLKSDFHDPVMRKLESIESQLHGKADR